MTNLGTLDLATTHCEEPMFLCVTEITPVKNTEQAKAVQLQPPLGKYVPLAFCLLDKQWELPMSESLRVPNETFGSSP